MTKGGRYIFPAGSNRSWNEEDVPAATLQEAYRARWTGWDSTLLEKVASVGKATPHTFRDTFPSRLIQRGFTLYEVQHLLGHASPAMTKKYAKLRVVVTSARASAALNELARQSPESKNPRKPHRCWLTGD